MAGPWDELDAMTAPAPVAPVAGAPTGPWDELDKMSRPASSTAGDVLKSLGTGAAEGVLGIPTMAGNLEVLIGQMGLPWVLEKLGRPDLAERQRNNPRQMGPTTAEARKAIEENVTGPWHDPETGAGKFAHTVGSFGIGAAFPGNAAQRVGMNVLVPAAGAEAAEAAAKGTKYETAARVAGALAAPTVVRGAGRAVSAPFPASGRHAAHVRRMEDEGVDLSAGNRTGYRPLQWFESVAQDTHISSTPARELTERQLRQFTAAALRRVGETGEDAGPEVMRRARQRIGNDFERLTSTNNLDFTTPQGQIARQRLSVNTQRAELEYERTVPEAAQRAFVEDLVDELNRNMLAGGMSGQTYQAWRSRLGSMADGTQDVQFARFLGQMQRHLDDAMEAVIRPADVAAWRTARSQWGHLKELQYAMGRAGEQAADGKVTPQALRSADMNANAQGYVEGTGRYADLARPGVATMPNLPNSGTPARNALTLTGLVNQVVPGLVMRGLVSPFMQGYLGAQYGAHAMRGISPPAARRAQAITDLAESVRNFEDEEQKTAPTPERRSEAPPARSLTANAMDAPKLQERLADAGNAMAPPAGDIKEGATASGPNKARIVRQNGEWVNPSTGQVFRDGQWQRLQ